jgi:hypothetical protein
MSKVGPAFTKPPRFNHIAMSVPADLLAVDGRDAIKAFYGDVFGFEEYEDLTKDRHMLVLRAHHHEQFVFLIAEDEPMKAPRMDHVGMSVTTRDDFDAVLERARAWKDKLGDEVDLIESKVEEYVGALNLHSFYVGYKLPLLFELQHFEYLF